MSRTEVLNNDLDLFFSDIPQHDKATELLLQDIQRGNYLLLVDNRGLENNTSAQRVIQLLNRPTEYIQLNGETTIESLTADRTFKDGKVIYEDSPLVKAVKYGYVLVVDEVDKAPTKVTWSLNHLMKTGEMELSDGRRIISKEIMNSSGSKSGSFIPTHKDFRMILMASRYGYPFYDNDFSGPSVTNMGEIGTTVRAVGSRPTITTAVLGGQGTGPHTATAIASGTGVATATALTYGRGSSTATAIASGSSSATATSRSYDEGVATSTAITSGSASVNAEAIARGNQHIDDTQIRS
ncbi:unnamed protein product [Parnassius apollo]|uniref:(apollo) hypothetical protein n=1 Tax=Parnassius apollo TaxID=110799 RepID=A0A8S3Y240_PARAO|nr:unnamed protein product [Parnassius apollo]